MVQTYPNLLYLWKKHGFIISSSFIILIIAMIFRDPFYGIFGEQNYLTIHMIMEFFLIITALTITIQSWMIFPHNLSNYRLWIGSLFFSVALLEFAHMMSYRGMPFFFGESSAYKATWFFIIARLTEVAGMLAILVFNDRMVTPQKRFVAYSIFFLYSMIWYIILFNPVPLLPELMIEGSGTTVLKNNLQYIGIATEVFTILLLMFRIRSREIFNAMLIVACIYMIVGDYFFTTYKSVYDIHNFVGHLFQLAGFYFLQRAFYHTSIEEPFQKQNEAEDRLKHMAFYDELTKLPNIRYLKDKWTEIINHESNSKIAFVILDIDRFKKINEALGQSFGDLVLQAAADRLKQHLTPKIMIVRLTGDEFALILPYNELKQDITTVIEQIHEALRGPLNAQGLFVNITMSIGISAYPDHGETIEELLKHANMALVEAQEKKGSYQFYHHSMDGKALDHLVLENDLYHALDRNELFLVYQPQINIETGKITGIEALLRWQHPKYGLVPPTRFIPIAEDTGLIVPIGEWVMHTACKQVKEWALPPIVVCVNLSIRQFYQQNLVETVKRILEETELPPQYLELEVTESMMMNMDHTKSTLQSLKDLGIHIAIDDFGTGYSSLSSVKYLKVDRLKIDQSFVRDLLSNENDTTIISAIISMAHHLQLDVIAEGVETRKQKEVLHKENCIFVQGYLYSPPLTPEELIKEFDLIQQKAGQDREAKEVAVLYSVI